jgi:hypothetical protein
MELDVIGEGVRQLFHKAIFPVRNRRDRFFALLGLAHDANVEAFKPDYSVEFEDVVCRFSAAFVKQRNGMRMLYRASISSEPELFPSWIPDWTCERPNSLSNSMDRGAVYSVAGATMPDIRPGPSSDTTISVTASVPEEIKHLGRPLQHPHRPGSLREHFEELDRVIDEHLLQSVYTDTERGEFKRRVPIGGSLHPKEAPGGNVSIQESCNALRTVLEEGL